MKKLHVFIFIVMILISCLGCEEKEEVLPIISNIDMKSDVLVLNEDVEEEKLFRNSLKYDITLEPYDLNRNEELIATIMIWQDARTKNAFFKEKLGIQFTGNFYWKEVIPMNSDKPITISIYDWSYHDIDLEIIDEYITTIKEVKYTIKVDNTTIDTQVIQLK